MLYGVMCCADSNEVCSISRDTITTGYDYDPTWCHISFVLFTVFCSSFTINT